MSLEQTFEQHPWGRGSFCSQPRYHANLSDARDYGVKKGKVNGLAMGVVFCIMFASYALAFWYGSELVRTDDAYSAGTVLVVSILPI